MFSPDFTIIVQGKPHSHSINNLHNYKKFGKVLVSCYLDDDVSMITDTDIKVIQIEDIGETIYNGGNQGRHVISTLHGLMHTDTKYTIKVRSDEYYTDLSAVIDKVLLFPDKYVTNNIWFKPMTEPLHPSDHMIAGLTSKLYKGFQLAFNICCDMRDYCYHVLPGEIFEVPWLHMGSESFFFLCWLSANGHDISKIQGEEINAQSVKDTMFEYTDLVPVDVLGEYVYTMFADGQRKYWYDTDELYKSRLPSLKSLTDLK